MTLCGFLLGTASSVLAAFIVWLLWWCRIGVAVGRYCGLWTAFDFAGRDLKPMPGNGSTTISRRMALFRPRTWLHPGHLQYEAEYDGSPGEGRVHLTGEIRVDPIALNRAVVSMQRASGSTEYVVQDYHLMSNGDIYVVPATSGWNAKLTSDGTVQVEADYNKHVLRRRKE
jgi:hypothetical protein